MLLILFFTTFDDADVVEDVEPEVDKEAADDNIVVDGVDDVKYVDDDDDVDDVVDVVNS